MTRIDHLLVILMEECAEVQQAVSKILRFGSHDGYPGTTRQNITDLGIELAQVQAVVEMLVDEGVLTEQMLPSSVVSEKKRKVEEFLGYSKKLGRLG